MIESVRVRPLSESSDLARPKSVSLGVPSAARRTFPGFRSRWTMPIRCASATPRQRFDQLGRPPRRPGRAVEPPVQAAAGDVLQLEERQAVGLADVVDLHDVGVLKPGDRLRLGQEASGRLDAGMGAAQDHLQDAGAVQKDLPGAVDDAHAAAAQLAQDLVAGDGGGGPFSRSRRIGWQLEKQGSIRFGSDKIPGGIGQLSGGLQIVREDAARKIGGIGRFARGCQKAGVQD